MGEDYNRLPENTIVRKVCKRILQGVKVLEILEELSPYGMPRSPQRGKRKSIQIGKLAMGKENKRNRDAVEVFFQQLYTHQQDKGMIMNNFPSAGSGEMQTEGESKFRENIQKFLEYIIIELWQTLQAYDDFHNPNKKKSQIGKTKETTITDILAILEKSSLGRE